MADVITQDEINRAVWSACDTFRGTVSPDIYKDYVLTRFSEAQQKEMAPVMDRACAAMITWLEKGLNSAMSLFNADSEK